MKKFTTLFMTAALIFGSALVTVAPAEASTAAQTITNSTSQQYFGPTVSMTPSSYQAPPNLGTVTELAWLKAKLAEAGLVQPTNVQFIFSDIGNCGNDLGGSVGGGCTYTNYHAWPAVDYTVIISPAAVTWWDEGEHVLYHEFGHAIGITSECQAEYFANKFADVVAWGYPYCATLAQGFTPSTVKLPFKK